MTVVVHGDRIGDRADVVPRHRPGRRRDRNRHTDQTLAADRQGRDRLRRRADSEVEPSHGAPPRSSHVPNTHTAARP